MKRTISPDLVKATLANFRDIQVRAAEVANRMLRMERPLTREHIHPDSITLEEMGVGALVGLYAEYWDGDDQTSMLIPADYISDPDPVWMEKYEERLEDAKQKAEEQRQRMIEASEQAQKEARRARYEELRKEFEEEADQSGQSLEGRKAEEKLT